MKKSIVVLIFTLSSFTATSQSYNTAAGLRIGQEFGFTLKQRVWNHTTIEGIAQTNLLFTKTTTKLFLERHIPIITRRFNIYLGGGIHKSWKTFESEDYTLSPYGLALIGGAEYTVAGVNFSIDLQPGIDLSNSLMPVYLQTGISIRTVLWKRKSKTRTWFEDKKWQFWKKKKSDRKAK